MEMECDPKTKSQRGSGSTADAGAGGFYFLGWLGALVYYIASATSFWNGVIGVLKSLVWPAFLVYHLFDFLKM